MKSITITIPEDLDERAAAEARRRGISKSELIREGLGCVMPAVSDQPDDDPWRALGGFGTEGLSAEPGEIDSLVYDQ
ncbi:MAG TPA: ribbon-helix-helix protein, CopG family [Streptosporangiaceae bacterium]